MKTQYCNVDTSTLKGLKEAERLKALGWTIYSTGLFIMRFYKKVNGYTAKQGVLI